MKSFLPHLTLAMSMAFVVLIVLDGYNPAAGYLNSNAAKGYELILAVLCIVLSFLAIRNSRK